jgi:hypothetical protein
MATWLRSLKNTRVDCMPPAQPIPIQRLSISTMSGYPSKWTVGTMYESLISYTIELSQTSVNGDTYHE